MTGERFIAPRARAAPPITFGTRRHSSLSSRAPADSVRPMATNLLATLRRELRAVADPARAPAMQAYMKSTMPYHGVGAKDVHATCARVFAKLDLASAEAWRDEVLALWRGARFREERYGAVRLIRHEAARPFRTLDALPLYEEIIVSGAWWDIVDDVAPYGVGDLLEKHPAPMNKTLRAWSRSDDMWKRRASIICQLRFKEATDLDLLYACIEPSIASREFFLRKAIGWALREHAWTDAREVVRYVRTNAARLSPLSKREALKNVLKEGIVRAIP
jgi:3-methyladenine DNA glycosylase AlkD